MKRYYIEYIARNMTAYYHGHFNFWSSADDDDLAHDAIRYAKRKFHLDGLQVSIANCQVIDWNDDNAEI